MQDESPPQPPPDQAEAMDHLMHLCATVEMSMQRFLPPGIGFLFCLFVPETGQPISWTSNVVQEPCLSALKQLVEVMEKPAVCRVCGCTDDKPCIVTSDGEPCHWVEPDLCSSCKAPVIVDASGRAITR